MVQQYWEVCYDWSLDRSKDAFHSSDVQVSTDIPHASHNPTYSHQPLLNFLNPSL
jgi:hypothetical protein